MDKKPRVSNGFIENLIYEVARYTECPECGEVGELVFKDELKGLLIKAFKVEGIEVEEEK